MLVWSLPTAESPSEICLAHTSSAHKKENSFLLLARACAWPGKNALFPWTMRLFQSSSSKIPTLQKHLKYICLTCRTRGMKEYRCQVARTQCSKSAQQMIMQQDLLLWITADFERPQSPNDTPLRPTESTSCKLVVGRPPFAAPCNLIPVRVRNCPTVPLQYGVTLRQIRKRDPVNVSEVAEKDLVVHSLAMRERFRRKRPH